MKEHRIWLITLALALILLTGSDAFLHSLRENLMNEKASLAAQNDHLSREIKQLQDDAAKARELSQLLDAGGVEKYLAPVDRLQTIAVIEPMASSTRLSRFTYTLSPETPDSKTNGLELSTLALQAEAPHDLDVYRFIALLQQTLPGRLRLQQLGIERLNPPLSANNVRMTATFEWLKNAGQEEIK